MAIIQESTVEGPITQPPVLNGNQLSIVIAGVTVLASLGTIIRTPTKQLNLADVEDLTSFPGRDDPGFVNGSGQAEGDYDTNQRVLRATKLFLEPGEHVLVGPIENPANGGAIVNGVNIELTNDYRIPSDPILNEFGFSVQPGSIPLNSLAAAEGYFDGTMLRAFRISVDAPEAILTNNPAAQPQISLQRARAAIKKSTYRLDIRGAVTLHHAPGFPPQQIDVYRSDEGGIATLIGRTTSRRAPGTSFGKYDQEFRDLQGDPPIRVRVVNISAPGQPSAEWFVD